MNNSNPDRAARLTDLLPEAGSAGFGSAVMRLAQMAAALHRAEVAGDAQAWKGLTTLDLSHKDTAWQGSQADARSVGVSRPGTTEGDR